MNIVLKVGRILFVDVDSESCGSLRLREAKGGSARVVWVCGWVGEGVSLRSPIQNSTASFPLYSSVSSDAIPLFFYFPSQNSEGRIWKGG